MCNMLQMLYYDRTAKSNNDGRIWFSGTPPTSLYLIEISFPNTGGLAVSCPTQWLVNHILIDLGQHARRLLFISSIFTIMYNIQDFLLISCLLKKYFLTGTRKVLNK